MRLMNNTEKINHDFDYSLTTLKMLYLHSQHLLTGTDSFQYHNDLNSCLENREGINSYNSG